MSRKLVQLGKSSVKPTTWEEDLDRILNSSKVNEFIEIERSPIIRSFLAEFYCNIQEAMNNVNDDIIDKLQVQEGLMQSCVKCLSALQYKTTMLEISIASQLGELTTETPNERYLEYFKLLEDSLHLREFFDTYPVLARCLTEHTIMFSSYVREIMVHYNSDWIKFKSKLKNGCEYDCLTGIEIGTGDTHNKGKSVAIFKFNSGAKLVYKPHSLRIDECYSHMLDWINQRGIKYILSSPNVFNCGAYGYHEFISHNPCQSIMEVEQFYYRLGALTALCYTCGATDYHSENIIASGTQPVLIDLETIFTPLTESQLQNMLGEQNLRTVFSSLMLPGIHSPNPLLDIDLSAVGARGGQKSQLMKIQRINNIGTDEACLIDDFYTTDEKQNRPLLNGEYMDVSMYTKQMTEGFCDLYRLILMHRDTFVRDILLPYSDAMGRHVFRATSLYGKLLSHSMHPDYLQSESDRNRLLHIMVNDSVYPPQAVFEFELEQMQRQDVPYFKFSINSHDLYDTSGVCIRNFYPMSIIELVEHYLMLLSEEDLSKQLQYLRWSLSSLEDNDLSSDGHSYNQRSEIYNRHITVQVQALINNESRVTQFQQFVTSIGNSIMRRIVKTNNSNISCIGFAMVDEENKHKPVWLEHNIYNGLGGYVLYLAQLTYITCDQQYREMAQQLLNAMQLNKLELDKASELNKEVTISTSAFFGEGGHIYALIYCGLLWKDDTLLIDAKNRLPVLMRAIEQETEYDIIAGLAGCIIVLLRVYEAMRDVAYLHVAKAAGERLYTLVEKLNIDAGLTIEPDGLTNQEVVDKHSITNNQVLLTGLSHGAAGLAWAFIWLTRTSNNPIKPSSCEHYLIMAKKLLMYENHYYSENEQNWKDLRYTDRLVYADFWCHGAPGIALGRAEIMHQLDAMSLLQSQEWEFVTQDYKNALQTLLNRGSMYSSFCLCHGILGNAGILLHLSKLMNDSSLSDIANNWAMEAIVDYKAYQSSDRLIARLECDGLMTGTVGMGYEYLRLLDNRVPSILAFELPR
ncbi:type 2 lanthipeptide synthetase LanM family protein [Paenibacillus sp. N1-5-1-14]|uniref:type 2 lanthipeptide synthetase LanM family protein n=1 Tax=Paenibacillus radicibacter TaxID=2972488 RepID=UPI002159AD45|nr:type 2 lanthipeptide synthetase LanM family protein [Paenibacillus radicibacter]MCR8641605.1 type 2 lanthipeptide synthetase LanM family protein [Paenibacillus radicibacter]